MSPPRPPVPATQPAYVPQLDALRAFAVAAVVVYHVAADEFGTELGAFAAAGVRLFFVLSGFLITGILLRSRDRAEAAGEPFGGVLRRFYARRSLRIFPLYYLVVGVSLVLAVGPAREIAGWLLTYTLNLRMAHQGWFDETFAHFWSLCVEEQFYVAWPCVVLFCPRRHLVRAGFAMALAGPAWKLAYVLSGYSLTTGLGTFISPFACLDSLGAGAVIALLGHADPTGASWRAPFARIAVPTAAAASAVFLVFDCGDVSIVLGAAANAVVFAWIVLAAARTTDGAAGAVLGWKPLQYVGRISYGVYVYHPFVPALLVWAAGLAGLPAWPRGWIGAALTSGATLALAAASWRFFEKPINDLKRRFEDPPPRG